MRTPASRKEALNLARRVRADEGWLGHATKGLPAWPAHPTDSTLRRVPAGVRARNDNLDTDAVDGRVLKPSTVTDGHIQGRLSRNSVPALNDLDGSLDGGKLQGRSIPADKLASVDGRDIQNKSIGPDAIKGIKWDDILDPPDFSNFVRQGETKKFLTIQEADRRYRRK
jgi:hypothetical protein